MNLAAYSQKVGERLKISDHYFKPAHMKRESPMPGLSLMNHTKLEI
jgi:hypothetical protein